MLSSTPLLRAFLRSLPGVLLCGAAAVGLLAGRAATQPEQPAPPQRAKVPAFDFEGDALDASWWALDPQAKLSITTEPANVASGKGALEFLYPARQGAFEQMGVSGLTVERASCLTLKLKAASATSVSLGVQERGGAIYQGLLWLPAGKWVSVRSRLDDLILAEGSTDANGHLDPAEITTVSLADLANLPGETGHALGWKEGEQRLWTDDLALTDDPQVPSRGRVEKLGDEWLAAAEGFESDTWWVLPIRQAGLKLVEGAPKAAGRQALEFTYAIPKGRWVGFVTAPPGWMDFAGATKFHLWFRGPLDARLVVVLEERDGTKYETALKVPPDNEWHQANVPLSDFLVGDEAAGQNAQLDPGQVHRVIILVDTFDASVKANGTGTVAVDDLGMILPAPPAQPK